MIIIEDKKLAEPIACPYLPNKIFVQEYFFAYDLTEEEFEGFLASGWRTFGIFFFRPACPDCKKCLSIRILTEQYLPTKSQQRVWRKNFYSPVDKSKISKDKDADIMDYPEKTEITIAPVQFTEERYKIYEKHSFIRFNQTIDIQLFQENFCISSVPSFVMEYRREGALFGTGYLNISTSGLSSIYFAYDPDFSFLSPGILSMIVEITTARNLGKKYYYPGYYVKGNHSMEYKGKFLPYEVYDTEKEMWIVENSVDNNYSNSYDYNK